MASSGTLVIAIVVPLVVPFGAALFALFFVLQYKRLRRLRVRLEVERRLADRAAGNCKIGVTRQEIREQCPLVIYKGRTRFGKGPYRTTKPVLEKEGGEEEPSEGEFSLVTQGGLITLPQSPKSSPRHSVGESSTSASSSLKKRDSLSAFVELAYSDSKTAELVESTEYDRKNIGKELDGDRAHSISSPRRTCSNPTSRKNSRADALRELLHMNLFERRETVFGWASHLITGPVLNPSSIPGGVCSICIEDIKKGKKLRLLRCKHAFHARCVERWLMSANRCPLCNQVAVIPKEQYDGRMTTSHDGAEENSSNYRLPFHRRLWNGIREAFSDYPSDLPILIDEEGNHEQVFSPRASEETVSAEGSVVGYASDEPCRASEDFEDSHHIVEFSQDNAIVSPIYHSSLYFSPDERETSPHLIADAA
ncbi:hypothetical protein GpartN1_g3888.t1 [Galdieria partita]|uniref:RING-type domain-containing protein n=1 Tax=Galdieria partita TaxID=83374 RepID=A0A9C7UR31_9RHOD|nr:hypothetical protein GpartN1_g3888.t1 [Galdieria partita]